MNNPTIHIANKKRTCPACLFLCVILLFVGNIFISNIQAQSYPVQVITQITPPYSVYLADYTAIASNKLTTTLLLTDIAKMSYPVKLRLVIEGDAGTISTSSSYMAPPIMLDGGSPLRLTGDELSEYFNPRNLDFKGYSRDLFLKTGALPEGVYRIGFQVLDYNKSIAVSLLGSSAAWIVLNDPPIFNTPEKDTKLIATEPQNILFQWMPRHLGSPNSAFSSEYVFQLYEIWPIGRNPNEVVNATQPLVEKTLQTTTFLYSSTTDAALIPGRQYAYRVQARDVEGRDLFRNKGYSEVQMFTYGDPCGVPENIQAQAAGSNKITLSWLATPYNNAFYIQYREANSTTWYPKTSYINGVTIDNLSPQTKYEYQLQGQCGSIASDFSEINSITTQPQKALTVVCGKDDLASNITSSLPLTSLLPADIITSGKFEVQVTKASGSKGVYSGEGFAHIPFMGVKVNVTFSNIHINDKFQVTAGRIVSVYNPNSNFIVHTGNTTVDSTSAPLDTTVVPKPVPVLVSLNSPIDSIYKTNDSTVLVVTNDGQITTVNINSEGAISAVNAAGDTIAASKGETITVADNSGNSATIDKNGNVTFLSRSIDAVTMSFAAYENQTGGFDAYDPKYSLLDNNEYYTSETINGKKYYIPWKSVTTGTADYVLANISSKNEKGKISLSVTNPNGVVQPLASTTNGTVKQVTVTGQATSMAVTETLTGNYAASDTSQQKFVAGKLNVVTYPALETNVVIIPVNANTLNGTSIAELESSLNTIFKQACIKINVTQGTPLNYTYTTFDAKPDSTVRYSNDMYNLIKLLKAGDESKYYLFLLDKSTEADLQGIMPFNQPYGFIFTDKQSGANLQRTIAHELGHGAFGLLHTFKTYGHQPQFNPSQTDNLMDYAQGSRLFKYQWDFAHNPVCYLEVCGKDAELMATEELFQDVFSKSEVTFQNKGKECAYYTPSGKIIILPSNVIPNFKNSTSISIPTGALVGFKLEDKQYIAKYSKINGKWNFDGYYTTDKFLGITFQSQFEADYKENEIKVTTNGQTQAGANGLMIVVGVNLAGEAILGELTVVAANVFRGITLAAVATRVSILAPLILTGDTRARGITGDGAVVDVIPLPFTAIDYIEDPKAIPLPVTIPHAVPKGSGNCNVYVIFYKSPDGKKVDIAKFGQTCQSECDKRPDLQCRKFNQEENCQCYSWRWLVQGVSYEIALTLEKSLTASYVIANGGKLPDRHKLPCFTRGGSDIFDKRIDLAKRWLEEMINKFGK